MYVIRPTWPSGVSAPSYRRCAIDIVRFGLKLSLRLASCWSVEVVNGGAGLRFCFFVPIEVTRGCSARRVSAWCSAAVPLPTSIGLPSILTSSASNVSPAFVASKRPERPVLPRDEGIDLALPLDHEADGHGLHAPGRQAAAHLAREQRAQRVADEPVHDPARLLGVDEVRVDVPRVRERLA